MVQLSTVKGLRCVRCSHLAALTPASYTCEHCGGNLDVEYDYAQIQSLWDRASLASCGDCSLWRYLPLFPVKTRVDGPPVGWTPLIPARDLGECVGVRCLYVKDESRNPTGSLKDRASVLVLGRAREVQAEFVVGASSGNAAASTAALAAPLGIRCRFYVPRSIPPAKAAQLLVFGAEVHKVDGGYDEAFGLSVAETEQHGWYNRNTGYNPITREGKKSVAFEICEQLGWEAPHLVVVPVGDGNILSGVWKGFRDFHSLGFINRLPRLLAVQPEGSAAVVSALESGVLRPCRGETVADSVAVRIPRDGEAAVRAVRESGGGGITVTDDEILAAIPEVARRTGVFAEPAASCAWAGLKNAVGAGKVCRDWTIVLLITGSGLKDMDAAMRALAGRDNFMAAGRSE
jgi:threonine synthase